jgi:hypothetical protein
MYVKYDTSIKRYIESEYYIDDSYLQVEYDEEGNVIFPKEYALQIEKEKKIVSITNLINEAKAYLTSTDFYFTIDKYATLSEERKLELKTLRAEARKLINDLES